MKITRVSLVILGSLLVLPVASPAYAQATRTWVSGVGDDANPCSRTAPCKTFAGAISKTAPAGEIDCLDPGGFGAVTITKSITIDCNGVTGGILSSLTNGIIVNAGVNDRIALRHLDIQGVGNGLAGVRFLAGKELILDHVTIRNVTGIAVDVNKTALGFVYATDCHITGASNGFVLTTTASFVIATINRCTINGVTTDGVRAASANAIANISNTVISNSSGSGAIASASSAIINANNNVLTNNSTGFSASSGASLRLSNNDLYDNTTGINVAAGASFLSGGGNHIGGGSAGSNSTGGIPTK